MTALVCVLLLAILITTLLYAAIGLIRHLTDTHRHRRHEHDEGPRPR